MKYTDTEKQYALKFFNDKFLTNNDLLDVAMRGGIGVWGIRKINQKILSWNLSEKRIEQIESDVRKHGIAHIFFPITEMQQGRVIDLFYKKLSDWFQIPQNKMNCRYGLELDEGTLSSIRRIYKIKLDETILFFRDTSSWNSMNQGLVISDEGFYCIPDNNDEKSYFYFGWKDFDQVKYKELVLYFQNKNGDVLGTLSIDMFVKGNDNMFVKGNMKFDIWGPKLAESLTQIAAHVEPDIDPFNFANEGKFDEALEVAESNLKSDPNNTSKHIVKARVILLKEREKNNIEDIDEQLLEIALKELQKAKELTDPEDLEGLSIINVNIGYVNEVLGQPFQARNAFIMALDRCDKDDRDDLMQELVKTENILKETWDKYTTTYEYKERKFIMPIKDNEIGGCVADGIDVFRTSNIPSCFKFPTGHPVANQLYIGHPYNPSLYVPFENHEDIFFIDKVHELCYLLECLGAEEINITSIKGKSISELNDNQRSYSGGADVKLFSGEASGNTQTHHQGEMTSNNQRTMKIKLDPMRKPFLPNDLIWYDEETQWQRLVNSRINGNMLEYNEFVSTSDTKFTHNSEKKDIETSAKYLWAKVHAGVEQNIETQFKEAAETQWKVEVKFRSIKDFANVIDDTPQITTQETKLIGTAEMTDDEQSYAEEVKFCLEDGTIGDKERRFLERMRTKLGISPERAAEIEASLQKPLFTEEEQEYLEVIKDLIIDGTIPESSRKILNRWRQRLNISEERASDIEKMI